MRADTGWPTARRLEELAGEARVNLLRLLALIAFYGHHLVNVYLLSDDPSVRGEFHFLVTSVVLAWTLAVLLTQFGIHYRLLPSSLKYVTTLIDLLLITALLVIASDPRSPFFALYFLVIAGSALRLSLPLVGTATLAALAAFAFYLSFVRWGLELPIEQRLPRSQQVIILLALAVAGLLAGQVVRQCRRMWLGHAVLLLDAPEKPG